MADRDDRFTWHPGDVEMDEGPHWRLSYEWDGTTVLVQDADGLIQALMQQGGTEDLQGALAAFLTSPEADLMPESIWQELEALRLLDDVHGLHRGGSAMPDQAIPFAAYPDGGRTPLGPRKPGDGTARHGYGLDVLHWCGFRCAYCGLDMGTYDGWLQLSVDHVVSQQMAARGWPSEWLLDQFNIVACCMACNGLFNRDPAVGDPPARLEDFLAVRDALFLTRRTRIVARRKAERVYFEAHIAPAVAAARGTSGAGWRVGCVPPMPLTRFSSAYAVAKVPLGGAYGRSAGRRAPEPAGRSDRRWRHEEAVDVPRHGRNRGRGVRRDSIGSVVIASVALGRRLARGRLR